MTQQYLIGELSVRLEQLEAVTSQGMAREVARLRRQVEEGPVNRLRPAAIRALALADSGCWESLSRGDVRAFSSQSALAGELRLFSVCARLLADD